MNSIQKRVLCNDCFKQKQCKIEADDLMRKYCGTKSEVGIKYYNNERCKGFLTTKDALSLIQNEKLVIRNFKEEVIQNYKLLHHVCKCKKVGQIGIGLKKGIQHYEWSVLGRVLGSWSQAFTGGYFLFDMEYKKYIKVSSFRTLEEGK